MRIVYVLLSPTFGMHQYTADLANRVTADAPHLVTTQRFPRDRYAPWVTIHTPARTTNTGLSAEILRLSHLRTIGDTIIRLAPDLVHFTGPHLWNVPLVRRLTAAGIPVLHTIHDLDPHSGTRFGFLLHLWNRAIIRSADHILLHSTQYRQRLVQDGLPAGKVTHTPLLHLFLSHARLCQLEQEGWRPASPPAADQPFTLLFFGRLERYKGIDHLLTAFTQLRELSGSRLPPVRLILAGPGRLAPLWPAALPAGVELRNRLIEDDEALALFQAADLVLLPYADASQSALVASAAFFGKPVLVTRAGALAEYVTEGVTGFVAEPAHPASLARLLAEAVSRPQQTRQMGLAARAWYERQRAGESADWHALCQRLARPS
jgi:glycosyltransferase involved in cell wall biosynthesis